MRTNTHRPLVAALVALTVVTAPMTPLLAPRVAHAQEAAAEVTVEGPLRGEARSWTTAGVLAPAPRIMLTTAETLALTAPRVSFPFRDKVQDIRLSSGAKTAIIVGAIVVGVLLLVGLVVIAKPGKKP